MASLSLVRSSSLGESCSRGLPWGPSHVFSWTQPRGPATSSRQLFPWIISLRVGHLSSHLVLDDRVSGGKSLLVSWWEKSHQHLGWCCQLALGDSWGKASPFPKWGNQASLSMPQSLCPWPPGSSSGPASSLKHPPPSWGRVLALMVRARGDKPLLSSRWCLVCLPSLGSPHSHSEWCGCHYSNGQLRPQISKSLSGGTRT